MTNSDPRAMLKLEVTDNSLTVYAWLPETAVTDCLARVAAAWISRGCAPERTCWIKSARDRFAAKAAVQSGAAISPAESSESLPPSPDARTEIELPDAACGNESQMASDLHALKTMFEHAMRDGFVVRRID